MTTGMTWGEFVDAVESAGVRDDDRLYFVDVDGLRPATELDIERRGTDEFGLWITTPEGKE